MKPDAALRWRVLITVSAVLVLAVFALADGPRWDRFVLYGAMAALPWFNLTTLDLAVAFFPVWLTAAVVESQRFLPMLGPVHTGDFYAVELALFHAGTPPVTWTEWLYARPVVAFDLLCGAAYALFVYFYVGLAVDFFVRERPRLARFAWAFLVANSIGAVVYMIFPVAPPWYVIDHGLGPADLAALGSAAGCARFDAYFGIHYFEGFYARNPNVFGAMPSLHAAIPVLMTCATWHRGTAWRIATLAFAVLVAFAALYLAHHYVLDVVAGIATGLVAWAISAPFRASAET